MKLSFHLQLQKGDFQLDAQAEIPAEAVTAIIGPSGAGKSSLLRCLAGLEPNATGSIQAGEESWLKNGISLSPHFRRIGFVFQHAALFEHLSVARNLAFARKRALDADLASLPEIARATRIEHLLDRDTATLSGGERQRVAIARTLAANPQLLLLDEPLSAVDEAARAQLSSELEHLFRTFKIPALYVTHNLAEAARLSDYALRMDNGKILAQGPTKQILAAQSQTDSGHSSPFSIIKIQSRHDLPEDGLAQLETDIGPLLVPANSLPRELPERLLIRARDIGLSLAPIPESSFLNQLPATVESLASISSSQTLVQLKTSGGALHALVTRRSAAQLQLAPGLPVHALIKSVTLAQNTD